MNKLFKKILYNATRPYAKKYLTGHLGKVVEDNEKSIDAQMGVWKQQDAFRKTIDPIGSFQVRTDYSASEYLRKNYGLPNIIQGAQYGQYTAAQIAESKNELVRLGIIKPESLRKN